ncbi:MAG: L-threonylcarbamoyladenylate synthase [Anaerolineae bacterium]
METKLVRVEEAVIERAAALLRAGGLVAFPTDTVYGLAALPTELTAVVRIYEVKSRDASRPIALLLSDIDQLDDVAVLPQAAQPLVRRFWPGGLTLVLPKTEEVGEKVSPGPTVGVRIPHLALARQLIRAAGGRLAVTSANRSGEPAALTAHEVLEKLGGRIELILDGGRCPGGVPSTVLDCTVWPPLILRHGAVPEDAIRRVLQRAASL